jgi:hypothetical protein
VTTEILERDLVGLIRDNLVDVVAAHALREGAGQRTWKVSLSTVDGSEVVLRTGLTQDWAQRMAAEASGCILTLRTGREYPEDRLTLPACTVRNHGVTVELRAGVTGYVGTDGSGRPEPAWRADVAARLEALRSMTLRQLAEHRLIPADAWRRLGAAIPERLYTVYWRPRPAVQGGRRPSAGQWHLTTAHSPMTVCGLTIPTSSDHEVHDSRAARVYPGVLPACEVCTKIRDGGTARQVRP